MIAKAKFVAIVGAAAIATGAVQAEAQARLVTFDTAADGSQIASGTRISNQYAGYGLSFALIEKGAQVSDSAFATSQYSEFGAGTGNSLYNSVDSNLTQSNANRADILRIIFSNAASNVSLFTNGFGDNTIFNAYNAAGILLQSITNTSGDAFNVIFGANTISRIDALQSVDDYTYSIDNLAFTTTSAVPEPAGWAMIIVGIGAIGFAMRRKNVTTRVQFA